MVAPGAHSASATLTISRTISTAAETIASRVRNAPLEKIARHCAHSRSRILPNMPMRSP